MCIAGYVPAMLLGQPVPLRLIGFVLQAVCAAAVGGGAARGAHYPNATTLPVEVRA